ncbi:mCG1042572, isoform CRA_a, partial [Mus musculus]
RIALETSFWGASCKEFGQSKEKSNQFTDENHQEAFATVWGKPREIQSNPEDEGRPHPPPCRPHAVS